MITQRSQLALKVEGTEGTLEAPAAANAVLCEDLAFSPNITTHERNTNRATLSRYPAVIGTRAGTITGKVALRGSGTAGTAPDFSPIMKCCGWKETVNAGTSIVYTPIDGDPNLANSYSVVLYRDGKTYTLLGSRGTSKLTAEVGGPMYIEFEIQGALSDIDDAVMLTGTSYSTPLPSPFLATTVAFTWNSIQALISKFEIDLGVKLAMRPDVNSTGGVKSFRIVRRDPKFRMDPEECAKGTADWWSLYTVPTVAALAFTIGATPGNIVGLSLPKAQIVDFGVGDREGLLVNDFGGVASVNSADDEIAITLT